MHITEELRTALDVAKRRTGMARSWELRLATDATVTYSIEIVIFRSPTTTETVVHGTEGEVLAFLRGVSFMRGQPGSVDDHFKELQLLTEEVEQYSSFPVIVRKGHCFPDTEPDSYYVYIEGQERTWQAVDCEDPSFEGNFIETVTYLDALLAYAKAQNLYDEKYGTKVALYDKPKRNPPLETETVTMVVSSTDADKSVKNEIATDSWGELLGAIIHTIQPTTEEIVFETHESGVTLILTKQGTKVHIAVEGEILRGE